MAKEDDRSSSLPTDIIETILLKLPAKSLLRLKVVSKSWNNLISDPRFIHAHLQRSKNSNSDNLFLGENSEANSSEKFSLIRFEDRQFRTEALLGAPESWDTVLCYCNGVVLLTDFSHRIFLLWNPSIQMTTKIWFHYKYTGEWCFGLCHDPAINDFKIVFVSWKYYSVYSCKTKSWTRRSCSAKGMRKSGLFVDGAVYWDRMRMEKFGSNSSDIIYFDSRGDKLKTLPKPKGLKNTDQISLIAFRDRLCVWFNNVDQSIVQIWMKEQGRDQNSWMQFMTIDNFPMPVHNWFEPLLFQENKIVIQLEGARFLVYLPFEKAFEEFEDTLLLHITMPLVPYVDSLVFFLIQKTLPQRKRTRPD